MIFGCVVVWGASSRPFALSKRGLSCPEGLRPSIPLGESVTPLDTSN